MAPSGQTRAAVSREFPSRATIPAQQSYLVTIMSLYTRAAGLDFELAQLPQVAAPDHILMADPAEFDVLYAINAHMQDADGNLLAVDREEARRQWWCLREALEGLGLEVDVLPPLEGFPDLVFCANQCLPIPSEVTGGTRL